jgi:hypothetical protein
LTISDTVSWTFEALIWNICINCWFASHFPGYLWSVPLKEGKKGTKEVVVFDCESISSKCGIWFKRAPCYIDTFQRLARFRSTDLVFSGPALNIKSFTVLLYNVL